MLKNSMCILVCCLVLLATFATAESEGFKVAGEIRFTKAGAIHVKLMTKETFKTGEDQDNDEQKETPFALIIKINEEAQQAEKVSFLFENVPEGTYGIQAFQDVNGNGKLDIGKLGPKEPWGTHRPKRPMFRSPKFQEIEFEVKEDIIDITFEVKQ